MKTQSQRDGLARDLEYVLKYGDKEERSAINFAVTAIYSAMAK